jgi:hypothetical protein
LSSSFATQGKKPKENDEPKGLLLSSATQEKKLEDYDDPPSSSLFSVIQEKKRKTTKDDDEPRGSSSSFANMKHLTSFSLMPTHIQIGGWSFLPALVQKQAIVGYMLKDHHYNKLPNTLLMDHIFGVFSFLTSLLMSHILDFLKKAFGIHKLFVN